jgi:hypothetical protein
MKIISIDIYFFIKNDYKFNLSLLIKINFILSNLSYKMYK